MHEAGFIIIAFGSLAVAVAIIVTLLRRHARAHPADAATTTQKTPEADGKP